MVNKMKGNSIMISVGIFVVLECEIHGNQRHDTQESIELNSGACVINLISSFLQRNYWKNVVLITNHKDIKEFSRRMSAEMVPSSTIIMQSSANATLNLEASLGEFSTKIIVWCDFTCVDLIFKMAKENSLLTKKNSWLIIVNKKAYDINLILLSDTLKLYLQEDSNVFVSITSLESNMQYMELRLIYYRFPKPRVAYHQVASYDAALKLAYNLQNVNIKQRLRGYHFTVGVLQYPPFMICNYVDDRLHFKGYVADLMAALTVPLGFTYNYLHNTNFPGNLVNGTWSGVMGLLQRKEANITGLGVNVDRREGAEFVGNMFVTAAGVAFRSPCDTPTLDVSSYLHPFSDSVWSCAIILWFLLAMLQCPFGYSVTHVDPFWATLQERKKVGIFSKILLRFLHAVKFVIDIGYKPLMQDSQRKGSSKLVLLTFLIFVLLLRNSYSSVLISTNTVQNTKWPFKDIGDLVEFGYKAAVPKNSMYEDLIKKDKRKKFKKAWEMIQSDPSNLVPSAKEGLTKVCRERYAFIDSSFVIANLASQYCRFEMITSSSGGIHGDLLVPKNAPYADIFSSRMLELQSAGILHLLYWKHAIRGDLPTKTSANRKTSVHFLVTAPAFVLLATGCVFAFLLLCIELLISMLFMKQCTRQNIICKLRPKLT